MHSLSNLKEKFTPFLFINRKFMGRSAFNQNFNLEIAFKPCEILVKNTRAGCHLGLYVTSVSSANPTFLKDFTRL